MKKYYAFFMFIVASLTGINCSKDNIDTPIKIPYEKITEGYAIGAAAKVELYSTSALTTGYNNIFIALYDSTSNQPIETATITVFPLMDMGTMKHSSPVENPTNKATNKLFNGAVVFTMPSGDMGAWTMDVNVQVNGRFGKLTVPLTITQSSKPYLKSFVSKIDNSKFFVALLSPMTPKVGVNDMEIGIFKVKNMMSFPADSSLSVTLTPEMPTMGHGSPNNIDPVHIGNGHYKGKVNFTMTGLWHLNLDFKSGEAVADSTTLFEVNF